MKNLFSIFLVNLNQFLKYLGIERILKSSIRKVNLIEFGYDN